MTNDEAVQWLYSAVPNFQRDGASQGNFSLAGMGMVSEAMPVNICQIPGTVILNIWVNREGKVIDVETAAGTTITDSCPPQLVSKIVKVAKGCGNEDTQNIGILELHVIPNVCSEYSNKKFRPLEGLTGQ